MEYKHGILAFSNSALAEQGISFVHKMTAFKKPTSQSHTFILSA